MIILKTIMRFLQASKEKNFVQLLIVTSIVQLVGKYMKETNETLKLKYKKKSKSQNGNLKVNEVYHCHHNAGYEKTRDVSIAYKKKPFKRFRNTFCPFQITFKVFKVPLNSNANLEHTHNHPINILKALSFKILMKMLKLRFCLCLPLV